MSGNRVYVISVPRVQIPLSAPKKHLFKVLFLVFYGSMRNLPYSLFRNCVLVCVYYPALLLCRYARQGFETLPPPALQGNLQGGGLYQITAAGTDMLPENTPHKKIKIPAVLFLQKSTRGE